MAVDSAGSIYVAGWTYSSDFPATSGAYDTTYHEVGGCEWATDAFVSKFDADLTTLLASTFLGGNNDFGPNDRVSSLALDQDGNIYVTGATDSSDFPITPGVYDTSYNGSSGSCEDGYSSTDVFVSKLDSSLSNLLASTFLGGSHIDWPNSIAVGTDGSVYVTGETNSFDYAWGDPTAFPTTPGSYDPSPAAESDQDAFVSKLNSDLTELLASTFLGGTEWQRAACVALDSDGNCYVAGPTYSPNFPTTLGAFDTSSDGGDAFTAKLDSDLSSLLGSTFLGGDDGFESARCLVIDSNSNIYVSGITTSSDFPATAGAYDTIYDGGWGDVFVAKLNSSLTSLSAATYLGGDNNDPLEEEAGHSIAIDSLGNVFVAGFTNSSNFPTTPGAYDVVYNGGASDGFVSKLSSDLSALLASTYVGGNLFDDLSSLALDTGGNVYIGGGTNSEDFPTTPDAYDTSYDYWPMAFVSKLDSNLSASPPIPDIKANGSDGPLTISNSADDLVLTVSLDPVGYDGRSVDWWARGLAPNGDKYWYVYKTGQWVKSATPIRAKGGVCKAVLPTEILNRGTMPVGIWIFHFGVDADMNNVLDTDLLHWDKVKVTVDP